MSRERLRIFYIREPGKSTPTRVHWRVSSKTGLYHATADGQTPACGARTALDEDGHPYGVFQDFASKDETDNRMANDTMTCQNCVGVVLCRVVSKDAPEVVETPNSALARA